jgi:hypothetical protein
MVAMFGIGASAAAGRVPVRGRLRQSGNSNQTSCGDFDESAVEPVFSRG